MAKISNYTEYVSLVNTIKSHDYRYFTLNAPTITDEQYDRLYFAIQDYETAHPEQTLPDSPTQSAHAEVKNGHKQIRRRTEMLSTEKAQTIEKVQKWMQKTTKNLATTVPAGTPAGLYTVEWKYDGISLSLVYIDGQLTEASYGKGMEGNDCLQHCLKVQSIPNTIPASGRVEVRGEMVVPFANLAKTGYKNCRSAAAGIMADTASTLTDCLEFHPYWTDMDVSELSVEKPFGTMKYDESIAGRFAWLTDNGFIGSGADLCSADCIERVIARFEDLRSSQSFPTDGLVIKVSDIAKWDSLGRNDHHPHYAIAYKFAAATAETTITRIEITTGRTGKRTPVAYFEPVTINGSTYQKASVGSEAKLSELGIVEGSRVIVSLRNDVIPHIEQVLPTSPETTTPETTITVPDGLPAGSPTPETTITVPAGLPAGSPSPETTPQETATTVPAGNPAGSPSPTPYVAPVVTPSSPICASTTPRPANSNRTSTPVHHFHMVGEPLPGEQQTTEATAPVPAWQNALSYIIAALGMAAVVALFMAGLGAALFFLPLLAGAFKK